MDALFVSPAKTYPIDEAGNPLEVKRSSVSLPALTILGSLKQQGYETSFIDLAAEGFDLERRLNDSSIRFGLPDEAVLDRIADINPDYLLITSMFSTEQRMVDNLIEKVRTKHSKLPIILGGIHASIKPEWHLDSGNVDFVVCGEGEQVASALLKELKTEGLDKTKQRRGQIITASRIKNLNLPWDFDNVLLKGSEHRYVDQQTRKHLLYQSRGQEDSSFSLYYSRGCPMRCNYCATTERDGSKIRHVGLERMFSDFQKLYEQYGIRVFNNQADTFGFSSEDLEFLREVAKYRKNHPDFTLNNPNAFFVRTFFQRDEQYGINRNLLDLLGESGFNVVTLAVETFNQRYNKKTNFGQIPPEKIRDLVREIHARGLKSNLYMIYGFPEQTLEELRNDEQTANTCGADLISWNRCTILPGTQYYRNALSKGWFTEKEYREKLYGAYRFSVADETFDFSNIPKGELRAFSQRVENSS